MELPLDDTALHDKVFAVTGVERGTVYVAGQSAEDAKQRTNNDDVPLWDIFCTEQVGRQVTNFKVRVATHVRPEIDGIARIRFGGLKATTYADGNRNIVSFNADTWVLGEAPSASRPPEPSPETATVRKKAA